MKNKTILVIAGVISLLACVTLLALGVAYDYGYDYEEAFRGITTGTEALEILIVTFASTFVGVCIFLWAFIKTPVKRKVLTVLTFLIIGSGYHIKTYYFPGWYFDYVIQDNPYDGHFVRDSVKDVDNRLKLKKEYPYLFRDTIENSQISITKYRAYLFGNKSEVGYNFNVCVKGESIKFVAIENYYQKADYCEPNVLDRFRTMSFTFEDLGNNSFFCKECKDYLLPIYWTRVE
ncbi:hypothetical protein L1D52_10595 [Vibrio brasiliensis]|jgi:hypothetical protein|uniref:hypothetical protein n=2 Tax=Vibrio brasiliensis TaxID=170652 RepID=UPI001EFD5160|nr:hypothetical protein [Vibrio brasiliensis]MCG9782804.1 hypothetical protein [Vibrio brasiliensis]